MFLPTPSVLHSTPPHPCVLPGCGNAAARWLVSGCLSQDPPPGWAWEREGGLHCSQPQTSPFYRPVSGEKGSKRERERVIEKVHAREQERERERATVRQREEGKRTRQAAYWSKRTKDGIRSTFNKRKKRKDRRRRTPSQLVTWDTVSVFSSSWSPSGFDQQTIGLKKKKTFVVHHLDPGTSLVGCSPLQTKTASLCCARYMIVLLAQSASVRNRCCRYLTSVRTAHSHCQIRLRRGVRAKERE